MKLHQLTLKGITSFTQEISIDFDKVLDGYDLFAITGATGSGKSSILSAISLALYGKTHKNLATEHYISLGSNSAYISLTFSTKYKKYTSVWKSKIITSAKSGKTRVETNRALFDEDGNALELIPEEVIGLNKEQFFKTVIINQGQFADFLTSSFTYRKKIIEQLYGSQELGLLVPTLRRRIQDKLSDITIIDAKLSGDQLHSQEEIEQLTKDASTLKNEIDGQREISKSLTPIKDLYKDFTSTARKYHEHKVRLNTTQQTLEQLTSLYNENQNIYNKHNKSFNSFKTKWKIERKVLEQSISYIQEINSKEKHLKQLNDQTFEKMRIIKERKEKRVVLENEQKNITDIIINHSSYKKINIENIESPLQLIESLSKLETGIINLQSLHESREIILKGVDTVQSKIEHLQNKISQYDKDWTKEENQLNKELSQLKYGSLNIQNIQRDYKSYLENTSRYEVAKRKSITDIDKLKIERLATEVEVSSTSQQLNTLLTEHNKNLSDFAISLCKINNQQQEHCVVCDQDIKHQEVIQSKNLPKPNTQIADAEIKVVKLHESIRYLDIQITKLIDNEKVNLKDQELKASIIISDLSKYKIELTHTSAKQLETLADSENNRIAKAEKNIIEITKSKQIYENLIDNKKSYMSSQKSNTENLDAINLKIEKVESLNTERRLNIVKSINYKVVDLDALENIKNIVNLLIKRNGLSRESADICESVLQLSQMLESEKDSINQLASSIKKTVTELCKTHPDYKNNIPQDIINNNDTLLEKMEEKEHLLTKQLIESEREKNGQLQQKSILEENIQNIELMLNNYCNKLRELSKAFNLLQPTYSTEHNLDFLKKFEQVSLEQLDIPSNDLFDLVNENFLAHIKHLTKNIELRIIEHSKAITIVEQYSKVQNERKHLQENKEELNTQLKSLENLKEVFNNDGFTKFALGFLEAKLLVYTNKELEKLCESRYMLIEKEISKRDGPEFFVVDKWQNGLTRKVATLSGGETFLISLAMALSLGEMSRGQTEVDTFIIDEGFGTLDDDSIEEVIEVLNSIRNRGKQIGLISHIEKLTKRIPVNFHTIKESQGSSQVIVEFN